MATHTPAALPCLPCGCHARATGPGPPLELRSRRAHMSTRPRSVDEPHAHPPHAVAAAALNRGGARACRYCVVGAGPAGLQMGHLMLKRGLDYATFERGHRAGTFFNKYPVHRR